MVNLNDRVDKLVFAQNEIPCVTSITPCVLISIQIAYDYLHKQIFLYMTKQMMRLQFDD